MFTRTFRTSAVVLTTALAVGTLGVGTATAAPHKPGPVTGLSATVTAHQDSSYDVAATWNAVATATSYRVSLTKGGVTLSSAKVSKTSWSPTVTTTPGNASLTVRALAGHKPGKNVTITVPLADVIAPNGRFSTTWSNDTGVATLTQDSLTDNSPVSGVTRTVNWDDGSAPEAWPTGTTLGHTYPLVAKRYVPTVTLEDAADNVRVVDAAAIVIQDEQAPTGSFATGTATAWAQYTKVTVTQSALSDNFSPADLIARTVDWGDGSSTAWTGSNPAKHVYQTAGTYTPAVTITDEAHNSATVAATQVVVKADTVGPKVKLILPRAKHSVAAYKTLRGKATDAGTGVKTVSLRAVEKRKGHWYGYNAATRHWLKAATKAKAFARSRAFTRKTNSLHRWSAKLAGLGKGTLLYKVRAVDHVKNRSATVTHQATLTTR